MIPASIPFPLMKFLKLRIEKQSAIFYNQIEHYMYSNEFFLNLTFQKAGAVAPVGPKVKPSRGGAVLTDSPKIISESG